MKIKIVAAACLLFSCLDINSDSKEDTERRLLTLQKCQRFCSEAQMSVHSASPLYATECRCAQR